MFPRAEEIQRAMAGCLAVLRRDPDAMRHFGDDAGAFLRSFFASVIVLPLLVLKAGAAGPAAENLPQISLATVALVYLVSWLIWPVAADVVARVLDIPDAAYFRYIAAYNWSQVPIAAFLLIAVAIAPELSLVAVGISLLYLTFLAQNALGISIPAAIPLVLLDFGLSLVLQLIALSFAAGGAVEAIPG